MNFLQEHALLDKQHHAKVAPHYDELVNIPRKTINDCLFKGAEKYVRNARGVMLDLGAGTGQMTVRFGGNFSEVFLVDHSKEMLEQAKKNIAVVGNVNFKLIETDAVGFIENTEEVFDFVACSGFLHHLDEADLTKTTHHICRVLKDGGYAVIAEPIKAERTEPALIRWWNKPVIPHLMQYLSLAPAPEETPLDLPSFFEIMTKAGLTLKYQRKSWEIYSRFNNGWQDRFFIPVIDRIWNDGVVWVGVFKKA
ncbi:MAG: class I SAM-dependent methyltransferase [Burkholderiales bacterium]|jgi:ubiquinone/menaquinone biosynthesis C-methylase UbiE|nr:class I SAM-dependent methyltransferase [Burkholderiales bacterium]